VASIYDLKSSFQKLLRPTTRALARLGVTANQVTLFALALSLMGGGLVLFVPDARWPLLVIPVLLFVRMALNAIDGMLAREHDMRSRLGALLNELGDVLSDAALYLPLATLDGITAWPVVLVVVLAIVSEMTGVLAQTIGSTRRYDGPMGKSDRAFVLGALALLLGLGVSAGRWVDGLMGLVLLMLVLTIVRRARAALFTEEGREGESS
jgi:CDP-diacylglycerol--glycerol-3-phosphate 3-phosphatidyltransferase